MARGARAARLRAHLGASGSVTVTRRRATRPVFVTVILKVAGSPRPTGCSPGPILIAGFDTTFTLTHVVPAGPLFPFAPSVVRVSEPRLPSGMWDVASTTVGPISLEVMYTVQNALA